MTEEINVAIAYDFDGTLVPGYMHDYGFFDAIGIGDSFKEFWPKVTAFTKEHDMDEVLSYMHYMLHISHYRRVSIHKEKFHEYGKNIKFFNGVEQWFDHINAYAKNLNIHLKHYIISSDLREIIQGASIALHVFMPLALCITKITLLYGLRYR